MGPRGAARYDLEGRVHWTSTLVARTSRGGVIGPRGMAPWDLEGCCMDLKVPWHCPSMSEVQHSSRSQGTNFETKTVKLRWF